MSYVTHYTEEEGGPWKPWPANVTEPTSRFLNIVPSLAKERKSTQVMFVTVGHNLRLHSLRYADGREWDVVNGWRKEG